MGDWCGDHPSNIGRGPTRGERIGSSPVCLSEMCFGSTTLFLWMKIGKIFGTGIGEECLLAKGVD